MKRLLIAIVATLLLAVPALGATDPPNTDLSPDNPPPNGCTVHFDDLWVNSSGKLALKITYGCRPGKVLKALVIDGWIDIKDPEVRYGKVREWRKTAKLDKTIDLKARTKIKATRIYTWPCKKRNSYYDFSVDSFIILVPRDPNQAVAINNGDKIAPRSLKCFR